MIDIKSRNRAIKTLLETAYGKGKVRVTGKKGTSYGWVSVAIDEGASPTNNLSNVIQRLLDGGIELGTYEGIFGPAYEIHVRFAD
jgi:hypothetical protein